MKGSLINGEVILFANLEDTIGVYNNKLEPCSINKLTDNILISSVEKGYYIYQESVNSYNNTISIKRILNVHHNGVDTQTIYLVNNANVVIDTKEEHIYLILFKNNLRLQQVI